MYHTNKGHLNIAVQVIAEAYVGGRVRGLAKHIAESQHPVSWRVLLCWPRHGFSQVYRLGAHLVEKAS
jgi:hypothetical protein